MLAHVFCHFIARNEIHYTTEQIGPDFFFHYVRVVDEQNWSKKKLNKFRIIFQQLVLFCASYCYCCVYYSQLNCAEKSKKKESRPRLDKACPRNISKAISTIWIFSALLNIAAPNWDWIKKLADWIATAEQAENNENWNVLNQNTKYYSLFILLLFCIAHVGSGHIRWDFFLSILSDSTADWAEKKKMIRQIKNQCESLGLSSHLYVL